jgi:signal transduction histidine kinase
VGQNRPARGQRETLRVSLKEKGGQKAEQNKERIGFISATIHELKTPLTAIIASAELLSDELQLGKDAVPRKLIQSIIRNAHSIDEKLYQFSEMARLLTRDFQFQPAPTEIVQVIHEAAVQLYPIIQSKRQYLRLELPDSLPQVEADKQCLMQIMLNLLTNASNSTSEKGEIKVSAWQDDDNLVVQVSDNGIGIPAEEHERIFEPYYQVKQSNEGRRTGSGLGLAIVKLLVELHQGKIWLKSIPGEGSSFFFSLPKV